MEDISLKTGKINGDILSILSLSSAIGWKDIRPLSIMRILYLCSLLYKFRFPDVNNPFEEDYEFTVDSRGPYNDTIINNSLVELIANDFIIEDKKTNSFRLANIKLEDLSVLPNYEIKHQWIDALIHILGIYGEEYIYDFIFRDPEYRDNISRHSTKPLNLDENNKTIETLNNFKKAFLRNLGDKAEALAPKDYLEMYFEFVFSKYLKGD